MANKTYTYSKLAEQDLIDIYLYSARTWGQKQADSYDAGLKHAIGMLVDSPNIGRACDDIKVGYRRFEHKHHTIFYRQRKTDPLNLNDMVQAIRMYQQQIAQLRTPDWVNDNITRVKDFTQRNFVDF